MFGFGVEQCGVDKDMIAKRVAEVLETVQLAGYQARYPRQLSGGSSSASREPSSSTWCVSDGRAFERLGQAIARRAGLEIKRLHERLACPSM